MTTATNSCQQWKLVNRKGAVLFKYCVTCVTLKREMMQNASETIEKLTSY